MYPRPFHYHRATSLADASRLLSELGEDARLLAGGQSLIPLMKLRLASPAHLVDLNFIPKLSYIERRNGPEGPGLRIGAMTRHAEVEHSSLAGQIPILHDCAAGIADPQVRNRGTLGGSLAEADPSGDWGPVLLVLGARVLATGSGGERSIALGELFRDAYTTSLAHNELLREIEVPVPPKMGGGACIALKRCAPVYATASVAVQLTLADKNTCADARIALGCVGLTAIQPREAEAALRGKPLNEKSIAAAVEAARTAADPQSDQRGSADYKRQVVGALLKLAIERAAARARGEAAEGGHLYA